MINFSLSHKLLSLAFAEAYRFVVRRQTSDVKKNLEYDSNLGLNIRAEVRDLEV